MKPTLTLFLIIFFFSDAYAQQKRQDPIVSPYSPLLVKDKIISLFGKQVDLHPNGLPAMIQTFFNPDATEISSGPKKLVTEPIHFHVIKTSNHKDVTFKNEELTFLEKKPGVVKWTVNNTSDSLNMQVDGSIQQDGSLTYTVKLTAINDIKLDNIKLHIPFTPDISKYIQGLGLKKILRPELVDWKWNSAGKDEPLIWIGDVNGGLQYTLNDNEHKRVPFSWSNGVKGGIHIAQKGSSILADNYSGERLMKKGDVLFYNFSLLITPAYPHKN